MVAKSVGQGTVTYVGNIYKYNIAYKLATEEAQTEHKGQPGKKN